MADENKAMAQSKTILPKLSDLHHDIDTAFKSDELNLLLNQPVHPKWIAKHPLAQKKNSNGEIVPLEYLPIDKVEFLLTRIFQQWRVEILSSAVMFQSVSVTVRLHYMNPVTGEWNFHDGIGAVGVQTDAGKSAADLSAIKQSAVQMALPAAKSYAIKDAAEHLGVLFGKDLNRKDTIAFAMAYQTSPEQNMDEKLVLLKGLLEAKNLEGVLSEDEYINCRRVLDNKETNNYDKVQKLLSEKKSEYSK